jgi:hypothetical protein
MNNVMLMDNHSTRSATIGSTFAARRAGIQQATSATTMSNALYS